MSISPRTLPALAALLVACGSHEHAEGEHDHHDEAEHHGHGAHGGHDEGDELPGQSVTLWTERTELFMEHRPLIVGDKTGFAAHLTEIPPQQEGRVPESFKALTTGTVVITLELADGSSLSARADAPSSPGIYRPELTPKTAGPCTLSMQISGPQIEDRFEIGPCMVYADRASAKAALGEEEEAPGRITYLKEQQWKTDFATAEVGERLLQGSVAARGEVRPAAGREVRVSASASGRLVLVEPPPELGMTVEAGQLLATIAPRVTSGADRPSLEAEVQAARAELTAARTELARAERLLAVQAVAQREVDDARARARVAQARERGAAGRLAQYGRDSTGQASDEAAGAYQVRAPISGTLVEVSAVSGDVVEPGSRLFRIIDLSKVWLVAQVFEPDIPSIEGSTAAWFSVAGYPDVFTIDSADNGRLVTIGRVLDPRTRTVPVVFEVDNADGRLRIGHYADVSIATGPPRRGVAIAESALVDEAGKAVAYVMVEGEAFERRPLRLGVRDRGMVEVLEGLAVGEHAVVRGAYDIRLSAASGAIPAHGHAH